jgi:hypothetical protein
VNYLKPARVGRIATALSTDKLTEQARVLELRLEGLTYLKIEEEMGWENKLGFKAMKVLREALKEAE